MSEPYRLPEHFGTPEQRERFKIEASITKCKAEILALEREISSQEYISASHQKAVADKQKHRDLLKALANHGKELKKIGGLK